MPPMLILLKEPAGSSDPILKREYGELISFCPETENEKNNIFIKINVALNLHIVF